MASYSDSDGRVFDQIIALSLPTLNDVLIHHHSQSSEAYEFELRQGDYSIIARFNAPSLELISLSSQNQIASEYLQFRMVFAKGSKLVCDSDGCHEDISDWHLNLRVQMLLKTISEKEGFLVPDLKDTYGAGIDLLRRLSKEKYRFFQEAMSRWINQYPEIAGHTPTYAYLVSPQNSSKWNVRLVAAGAHIPDHMNSGDPDSKWSSSDHAHILCFLEQETHEGATAGDLGKYTYNDFPCKNVSVALLMPRNIFFDGLICEKLKIINENAKQTANRFLRSIRSGNSPSWVITHYPDDAKRNDWGKLPYKRNHTLSKTISDHFKFAAAQAKVLILVQCATVVMNTIAWHEGSKFSLEQMFEQTIWVRVDRIGPEDAFSQHWQTFLKIESSSSASTTFSLASHDVPELLKVEVKSAPNRISAKTTHGLQDDSILDVMKEVGLDLFVNVVEGRFGQTDIEKELQERLDNNLTCMTELAILFGEQLNKQASGIILPGKRLKANAFTLNRDGDLTLKLVSKEL